MVTRRYGTLLLPGAETIVPLPREQLLAAGARALVAPILGAIFSAALLALLVLVSWRWPKREFACVAIVLAFVAAFAIVFMAQGRWEAAGFIALLELAAVVGWVLLRHLVKGWTYERGERRPFVKWRARAVGVAGALGMSVFLVASAVVAVHVWRPPVDLEYAEVALRSGGSANGIFLAVTENELFVAPAVDCKDGYVTHQHVVVVPRGDVQRVTLHRKQHVWDGGRLDRDHPAGGGCAGH